MFGVVVAAANKWFFSRALRGAARKIRGTVNIFWKTNHLLLGSLCEQIGHDLSTRRRRCGWTTVRGGERRKKKLKGWRSNNEKKRNTEYSALFAQNIEYIGRDKKIYVQNQWKCFKADAAAAARAEQVRFCANNLNMYASVCVSSCVLASSPSRRWRRIEKVISFDAIPGCKLIELFRG